MKLLGLLLIIFTGSAAGYVMSVRLKIKVRFFEELSSLIYQLKIKIRFSSDTVYELLRGSRGFDLLKDHIDTALRVMDEGESFPHAWEAAVERTVKVCLLDSEDKKLLLQLGSGIGVSDTDGQITHLELCSQLVETRLEQARSDAEKKTKVYRLLGVLGGIAAAVMLA